VKVYIVHRDVPYEFGEVYGVFRSEEAARQFISGVTCSRLELGIQIWETEGNLMLHEIQAPIK